MRTPIPSGQQKRCAPDDPGSRAGSPATSPRSSEDRFGSGLTPPPARPVGVPGRKPGADPNGAADELALSRNHGPLAGRPHRGTARRNSKPTGGTIRRRCGDAADDPATCGASGSCEAVCRKAGGGGPDVMRQVVEPRPNIPSTSENDLPNANLKDAKRRRQLRPLAGRRHPAYPSRHAVERNPIRSTVHPDEPDAGDSTKQDVDRRCLRVSGRPRQLPAHSWSRLYRETSTERWCGTRAGDETSGSTTERDPPNL